MCFTCLSKETTSPTIKYGATGGCFSPRCTPPPRATRRRPCCYIQESTDMDPPMLQAKSAGKQDDLQNVCVVGKICRNQPTCVLFVTRKHPRTGTVLSSLFAFELPFPQECGRIMDVVNRARGRERVQNKRQHFWYRLTSSRT